MNFSVLSQVISFLVANKEVFGRLVAGIEELVPDAPGATKAAAVRGIIGDALNIAKEIETVWPLVLPIFNLFVARTKGK